MSKRESIARYSLIIQKLKKHPSSFAQITKYLELESEMQGYNLNTSKRTFHRDVKDILALYNIDIQFDFSKKVYYIDYDDQPAVLERILEAFDTFHALNLKDRLSNHIHFEKRRPQGTENLYGLLHAIKNGLQIRFTYQKYWDDQISHRHAEPYALKEFRSRWYLMAQDLKDRRVKSFALDRLTGLEISRKTFQFPAEFQVNEHFRYCFGIISPNSPQPDEVILSFDPLQGKYIKSLPLHESQQIIADNEDELRIRLKLFITHDFYMELLSYGDNLKIIKPQSLIDDVKRTASAMLKLYK
jgi:predicted DNA-binding transcriptional regulator YafY